MLLFDLNFIASLILRGKHAVGEYQSIVEIRHKAEVGSIFGRSQIKDTLDQKVRGGSVDKGEGKGCPLHFHPDKPPHI